MITSSSLFISSSVPAGRFCGKPILKPILKPQDESAQGMILPVRTRGQPFRQGKQFFIGQKALAAPLKAVVRTEDHLGSKASATGVGRQFVKPPAETGRESFFKKVSGAESLFPSTD